MTGCQWGEGAIVVIPLSSKHALGREQIGVGALPTTRDGGAMEIDQQMMARSALEQVDAVVHVHLAVA